MKYFKNNKNEVFAFENNGSQDQWITEDLVPMTADEIDRHINPQNYYTEEEKERVRLAQFKPLTRYQFFRALLEFGYKAGDIEAKIKMIQNEYQRELVMLGWQSATIFIRTDESILMMQNLLEWSNTEVEQMWNHAMTI